MRKLFCADVWLPDGWASDTTIEIDDQGNITAVKIDSQPQDCVVANGAVVAGMPNLHSHAFQRAMAGLSETAGPGADSFWTWRNVMYAFVEKLTPEDIESIAAQLYLEMLKAGYTSVAEFHYLHNAADGNTYAQPTELSDRVIAAAMQTGIRATHLPVLYNRGGFGGQPTSPAQRRFVCDIDKFLRVVGDLQGRYALYPRIDVGIAPHSLRAVTPEDMERVISAYSSVNRDGRIHIHIAEQTREVEECIEWSGARPVQWLFDHFDVDERWCLIHATHLDKTELQNLAESKAIVGLCPTTEASLGDGLFPAQPFLALGGAFGIGSDSHISVSPVEELRWLEYGQRLARKERNVLAGGADKSTGANLYSHALQGGAQALGHPIGRIEPGCKADLLVIDHNTPLTAGKSGDTLIDSWIFAGNENSVREVIVGGQLVVEARRHQHEEAITARFIKTMKRLLADQ